MNDNDTHTPDPTPLDSERVPHLVAAALRASGELPQEPPPGLGDRSPTQASGAAASVLDGARQLRDRGRLEQALVLYHACLSEERLPLEQRIDARLELVGGVLAPIGRQAEAAEQLTLAIHEADEAGDGERGARARERLVALLLRTGEVTRAAEICGEITEIAELLDLDYLRSYASTQLAKICKRRGDDVAARSHVERALEQARRSGDDWALVLALSAGANFVLQEEGRLFEAEPLIREAIALHKKRGDRRSLGRELGNLAALELKLGERARAEAHLESAREIAREIHDLPGEAQVLSLLGNLFLMDARVDEACGACERSLDLHRQLGDLQNSATVTLNLGLIKLAQGEPEPSRRLLEEAIVSFRSLGNQVHLYYAQINLATLERLCDGNLDRADDLLDAAEMSLFAGGDDFARVHLCCERGHLDLAREDSAAAHLRAAEELALSLGVLPDSGASAVIEALRAASTAEAEGLALYRGSRVQSLTQGLRGWIARHHGIFEERGTASETEALSALLGLDLHT